MISKFTYEQYENKCKGYRNYAYDEYAFCFHCNKMIRDSEPSFGIIQRTSRTRTLYFHTDCFVDIAGYDWMIEQ